MKPISVLISISILVILPSAVRPEYGEEIISPERDMPNFIRARSRGFPGIGYIDNSYADEVNPFKEDNSYPEESYQPLSPRYYSARTLDVSHAPSENALEKIWKMVKYILKNLPNLDIFGDLLTKLEQLVQDSAKKFFPNGIKMDEILESLCDWMKNKIAHASVDGVTRLAPKTF